MRKRIFRFEEAIISEPSFVRPIDDSKHFAGEVFDPDEFETWRFGVCTLENYGSSLTKDTLVQICKPKEIYSEYRYWIVDRKIVTKSLYKRGNRVIYSKDVDPRFDYFVAGVIHGITGDGWQPHRAFVIDVCDTPSGIKIVEINSINSAGFYFGDIQALVVALEEMESK